MLDIKLAYFKFNLGIFKFRKLKIANCWNLILIRFPGLGFISFANPVTTLLHILESASQCTGLMNSEWVHTASLQS